MKKFLIFIILFSFVNLKGQKTTDFTFISKEGEKFFVIWNGQKINEVPSENVKIEKVNSGTHLLKIIFEDSNVKNLDEEIKTWVSNGYIKERKYTIELNKKKDYVLNILSTQYYEGTSVLDAISESLDNTVKQIEEQNKQPCELKNFGVYEFENNSDFPYNLYINGKFIERINGKTVNSFNLTPGEKSIKVEQTTGYLLYPTIKEARISVIKCKKSGKYIFPF